MSVARDLLSLLASAANLAALDEIYARVIDRILREVASGVTRPGAARARETLIRIREIARDIDPKRDGALRRWIYEEFPNAYYLGDDAAVQGIRSQTERAAPERAQGFPEPRTAFTPINQIQLRAQVAAITDKLSDLQRQILSRATGVVRRTQLVFAQDAEVRQHVIGGIIRGQTHRQVATDIARTILTGKVSPAAAARMAQAGFAGDVETWKQMAKGYQIQVGGWKGSVRAYVALTARTMQADLHRVGMVVRLQQNNISHVRISRHQQDKVDECTLYAGQVFYVGPGVDPLGFPSLRSIPNGGPPWHPNCAHVTEAFVVGVKPETAVKAALENVQRLPAPAFGRTVKEVRELVEVLRKTGKLDGIAPKGSADIKPQPPKEAA
jgi:hypothetical protein